jgi:hypothetical protein
MGFLHEQVASGKLKIPYFNFSCLNGEVNNIKPVLRKTSGLERKGHMPRTQK